MGGTERNYRFSMNNNRQDKRLYRTKQEKKNSTKQDLIGNKQEHTGQKQEQLRERAQMQTERNKS